MKHSANIVSGGGWSKQQVLVRPKARLFLILSSIWLSIAIAVLGLFSVQWPQLSAYLHWLFAALLVPEMVLVAFAVTFWLTEAPRITTTYASLPDHNARNMY
ncbi:MAG: hypothetical protein JWP89_956 [Schlesneria sp.]|nr:hypothetical protein [Schlesneria sp.]